MIVVLVVVAVVAVAVAGYAWSYFTTKGAIDALTSGSNSVAPSSAAPPAGSSSAGALAEGVGASDAAGDASLHGADLTGFSWKRVGSDLQLTVSFAGPFDPMHNVHMYFRTRPDTDGADCPAMDNAQYAVDVVNDQAWIESVGPQCPNRSRIGDVSAQATSDGWLITVPLSYLDLTGGGQVYAAVLSATDVGGGSETTIQDRLPNSGSSPLVFTVPAN